MAAPPRLRLTETAPGRYQTWWSVPPDTDPGRYVLRGHLTQAGMRRAVVPLGGVVITPRAQIPVVIQGPLPTPPTAPQPAAPPPPPPAAPPPPPPVPPPAPVAAPPPPSPADYLHPGIRPDVALWVTPDDVVVVKVRNSASGVMLQATVGLWSPEGNWAGTAAPITPATDRSLGVTTIPLATGYLVSVAVAVTGGAAVRGQCLVSVYLQRGSGGAAVIYRALGQDYVTSQRVVGWPPGTTQEGVSGRGFLRAITLTQPVAGVDWSTTVPTAARWRLRQVNAVLTTSGVVANRSPELQILFPGVVRVFSVNTGNAEPANSAQPWVWEPGFAGIFAQVNGVLWTDLNPDIWLPAGTTIRAVTTNLQVADQWSQIAMTVEEWIED